MKNVYDIIDTDSQSPMHACADHRRDWIYSPLSESPKNISNTHNHTPTCGQLYTFIEHSTVHNHAHSVLCIHEQKLDCDFKCINDVSIAMNRDSDWWMMLYEYVFIHVHVFIYVRTIVRTCIYVNVCVCVFVCVYESVHVISVSAGAFSFSVDCNSIPVVLLYSLANYTFRPVSPLSAATPLVPLRTIP